VAKSKDLDIVEVNCSHKPLKLTANPAGGLHELPVPEDQQDVQCLSSEQIKMLADFALRLESHYNYPQDIEWALSPTGRLLVLQTRPLHIEDIGKNGISAFPVIEGYDLILEGGAIAFPGVGSGTAFHVESDQDLLSFPEGSVLIAKHSTPQFVIVMKKASAIVTDAGSITGHMASLAREFGVPTILDTKNATSLVKRDQLITVDAFSGRVYLGRVPELLSLQKSRESAMKGTPVYNTLRKIADLIVPLYLVNPKSVDFTPEHCRTLHDIMRFVHELSYREMFQISDLVSNNQGSGALKLRAKIPLDLHIIDLGDGLTDIHPSAVWVTVDQISSTPFKSLLKGMLHENLQLYGPRPIDLGGFFSVVREQMLSPNNTAERFGDRSYAIISDKYLNFSSRIGYHYSVLDSYCGESVSKNYITFAFKGGAADEVRKNRRVRAIGKIFQSLDFSVDIKEDRVDARIYKYPQEVIQEKLDQCGRLLQFTRQMDMLMRCESSVDRLAEMFLSGDYHLDPEELCKLEQPSQ
jgi:pyruvate,water dikinase